MAGAKSEAKRGRFVEFRFTESFAETLLRLDRSFQTGHNVASFLQVLQNNWREAQWLDDLIVLYVASFLTARCVTPSKRRGSVLRGFSKFKSQDR